MSDTNLFLTISLDASSDLTSYQQLVEQFKTMIVNGDLKTGAKVPSTRDLAKSVGSSRTTTIKSYDVLISEGFLIAKPKQGIFVADRLPTLHLDSSPSAAEIALKKLNSSDTFEKKEDIFLYSGADVAEFPHKAWAASMRRSWLDPDEKLMHGFYSSGLPELKTALVDYLKNLRGLECETGQIIITAGNRDALSILTNALIEQDKVKQQSVWLENPCFPGISNFFSWLGVALHPLDVDGEGAIPPQLKSNESHIALMTPNRQYPLGHAISSIRRQDWLSLLATTAEKAEGNDSNKRLWLIEDDYDNEFLYQGRMGVPLMNLDASHSTFFVGSFSKVLFRGIRLGFIVAPKNKVEEILTSQKQLGVSASLPMQAVVADFMKTGGFDSHLRRMRRHYLEKRNYVTGLLSKQLSLYFTWHRPAGGMHTLIHFKPHWVTRHENFMGVKNGSQVKELDVHIEQILQKRNIYITSLSGHYFYKEDPAADVSVDNENRKILQGFVLGFSQTPQNTVKMALEILMQQVRNHFL